MRGLEIILILALVLCGINCEPYTACLHDCSGKGLCKNGECQCYRDYSGLDCSETSCPSGIDWFDNTDPEKSKFCSNRGNCVLGKCECNPGFYGDKCDSFNLTSKTECEKNGGKYVLLSSLTGMSNDNDNRIYGCKCKNGYIGVKCDELVDGEIPAEQGGVPTKTVKRCPFGVNITTSEMTVHYSQFEITSGKKALSMKIDKNGDGGTNPVEVIVNDKTIAEIVKNIDGIRMVKISVKTTDDNGISYYDDISNDSNEKKLVGGTTSGITYRFTFPLNPKTVVTEVSEGESVVDDSNGVENKEITVFDFTIGSTLTVTKITIKKDGQDKIIDISGLSSISDIGSGNGIDEVRIYKYDSANSKWVDVSTSDSETLAPDTKYRFIFPFNADVELTKITYNDDSVIDSDGISKNKISMSEFTIKQSGTAELIFIQKGNEDKKVDISSPTDKISDIISKIKANGNGVVISDVIIYKYESSNWNDKTESNENEKLSGDNKYRFLFPLDSNVKVNDLSGEINKISNGGIATPSPDGDYYTEANSVFTLNSGTIKNIIIQNTISYSTSLSTIVTDVNEQPDTLYSKDIEISTGLTMSDIIKKIIDSNIVKMVKIYKDDSSIWKETTDAENLDASKKYKFSFPLDPYAKVVDVSSGKSVIENNKIEYTFTPSATPSSTSTFTLSATPNHIAILAKGVVKIVDISSNTTAFTNSFTVTISSCSGVDCTTVAPTTDPLTSGTKYQFKFTGSDEIKVVGVTDGVTVLTDSTITVNDKVFNEISVFGKTIVISECSGHGTCDRENGKCDNCLTGYKGDDCQLVDISSLSSDLSATTICPFGYSWFGINNNVIHGLNECSNQGKCNNGRCSCDSSSGIFIGENCEKLNMKCKNGMKMGEKALGSDDNIFKYINMKCDCGSLYSGNDCTNPSCPYGPVGITNNQFTSDKKTPPYYVLKCPTATGFDPKTAYRFEFTNSKGVKETSRKLRSGYTPKYWRKMLERINILRSDVIITNDNDSPTMDYSETTKTYSICGGTRPTIPASGGTNVDSFRIYLPGYCREDLLSPLGLRLIKDNSEETVKENDITIELGGKDNVIECGECGGHGLCNKYSRICKCDSGYSSSGIKYSPPSYGEKKGAEITDFKSKFKLEKGMKGDCSFYQ